MTKEDREELERYLEGLERKWIDRAVHWLTILGFVGASLLVWTAYR